MIIEEFLKSYLKNPLMEKINFNTQEAETIKWSDISEKASSLELQLLKIVIKGISDGESSDKIVRRLNQKLDDQ